MIEIEQQSISGHSQNGFDVEGRLTRKVETIRTIVRTLITEIEALEESKLDESAQCIDLQEEMRSYESSLIRRALRLARGNQRKAASMLGLRHTTLNSKIKRYNLAE